MQTDREFFANHLPDGDEPGHLETIRRTPVINGYPAAMRYLAEVRGVKFGRDRLVTATAAGELAYFPIGHRYCFSADDLDAFLASLRVAPVR